MKKILALCIGLWDDLFKKSNLRGKKMTKHTQGPWATNEDSWEITAPITETDDLFPSKICEVLTILTYDENGNECENDDETNANARLIAAAPDLLEALESALQNIICLGATEDWRQVQQYRAAISKAKGQ